ncbi:extensin family protein [Bradyrhizobium sp. HKCCYLR20261]|uniref:extensin family protein n=1 Tax=Bradyrhizobium sp. HKCCYLR20261 TaxID=3420760 RepID=UPI003EB7E7D2
MVSAAAAALALSWLMAGSPAAARSRDAGPPHAHAGPDHAARRDHAMTTIPLPQPRPATAPARAGTKADAPADSAKGEQDAHEPGKGPSETSREAKTPAPPQPSACRVALTEEIAVAPSIPPIKGPGACGGDDLVRLEAVVLPDKRRVTLTPAATMRCTMAAAVANWVRSDLAPLAARLGSPIAALDNYDSYQCRGRNNVAGAQMSEHGRANALDVRGFKLADGRMIELTDRTQPRDLRETVLHSVCTHFATVLGPDSDWYHEDHIHLDLAERRSNYRICQWDVLDPLPKVAPLMPAVRPDDAPPRETAETEETGKGGKAPARTGSTGTAEAEKHKAEPAPGDAAEADETEPVAPAPTPPPVHSKGGKKKHKSRS